MSVLLSEALNLNDSVCGIYLLTCLINNKQYIGQSKNIYGRMKTHYKHSKSLIANHSAVDKAIGKYGIENFTIEILEECPRHQLNNREQYWIQEKNTLTPNGYNLNKGGEYVAPVTGYKECSCYDLKGQLIDTFESVLAASNSTGIKEGSITSALKHYDNCQIGGGYLWAYGHQKTIPVPPMASSAPKKIYQYDANTLEFIREYKSITEASEITGINSSAIQRSFRGYENPASQKYLWCLYKKTKLPKDWQLRNLQLGNWNIQNIYCFNPITLDVCKCKDLCEVITKLNITNIRGVVDSMDKNIITKSGYMFFSDIKYFNTLQERLKKIEKNE